MSSPVVTITIPFVTTDPTSYSVQAEAPFEFKANAPCTFICDNPTIFNPSMAGEHTVSINEAVTFTPVTGGSSAKVTTSSGNQPTVARTIHILTHAPYVEEQH